MSPGSTSPLPTLGIDDAVIGLDLSTPTAWVSYLSGGPIREVGVTRGKKSLYILHYEDGTVVRMNVRTLRSAVAFRRAVHEQSIAREGGALAPPYHTPRQWAERVGVFTTVAIVERGFDISSALGGFLARERCCWLGNAPFRSWPSVRRSRDLTWFTVEGGDDDGTWIIGSAFYHYAKDSRIEELDKSLTTFRRLLEENGLLSKELRGWCGREEFKRIAWRIPPQLLQGARVKNTRGLTYEG